jgi:hypothetical protein
MTKKHPTPEQLKKIAANYKDMRAKVDKAGRLTLQMLVHPEATPAHIQEAVAHYKNVWTMLKGVHESCRQLPVAYNSWASYPWETPL